MNEIASLKSAKQDGAVSHWLDPPSSSWRKAIILVRTAFRDTHNFFEIDGRSILNYMNFLKP